MIGKQQGIPKTFVFESGDWGRAGDSEPQEQIWYDTPRYFTIPNQTKPNPTKPNTPASNPIPLITISSMTTGTVPFRNAACTPRDEDLPSPPFPPSLPPAQPNPAPSPQTSQTCHFQRRSTRRFAPPSPYRCYTAVPQAPHSLSLPAISQQQRSKVDNSQSSRLIQYHRQVGQ